MSYYAFRPGQVFSGVGALGAFTFNGSQVGADWNACAAAYTKTQTVIPACQRAVDAIRAALGQLGYGGLGMGRSWGSGDQAAYQQWIDDNGLSPSKGGRGMPDSDHMAVMEQQLKAGAVTGTQPAVEYVKVGDEYVPATTLAPEVQTAAIEWSKWGLIGLGAAGVIALAVVASKKKKKKAGAPPPRPSLAGSPALAARR